MSSLPSPTWYTELTVDILFDRKIREGDILAFDLGHKYPHHAIYLGHRLSSSNSHKIPKAIHYSSPNCCNNSIPGDSVSEHLFGSSENPYSDEDWLILEDSVLDLLRSGGEKGRVRVVDEFDEKYEAYTGGEVVERALEKGESGEGVDDEWVNVSCYKGCRHFALDRKFGENLVNDVTEKTMKKAEGIKIGVGIGIGAAAAAGVGYLLYKEFKKSEKEEEESD